MTVHLYVAFAPPWQVVPEEEASRRMIPAGGVIVSSDEGYVRSRAAALGWETFRVPAERWSFGLASWTGDPSAPW